MNMQELMKMLEEQEKLAVLPRLEFVMTDSEREKLNAAQARYAAVSTALRELKAKADTVFEEVNATFREIADNHKVIYDSIGESVVFPEESKTEFNGHFTASLREAEHG